MSTTNPRSGASVVVVPGPKLAGVNDCEAEVTGLALGQPRPGQAGASVSPWNPQATPTATGGPSREAGAAFVKMAVVGVLGGLVGLGGAEFRLPLLLGVFGFAALAGVIVNKTMSLVVVLVAIPARWGAVPPAEVLSHADAVLNVLAGSLIGAWVGASWATRMTEARLYRVLAVLLVLVAVLFTAERVGSLPEWDLSGTTQVVAGVAAGFAIGVVAALLGIAGGELRIPTFVLLYGVDTKVAGSLSLLVSLPTMLVAFLRYSRDQAFAVLGENARVRRGDGGRLGGGAVVGGLVMGAVPERLIVPVLTALLLYSAVKVWRHA